MLVSDKLDKSINGVIAWLVLAMSSIALLFRNEWLVVHRYQLGQEILHNIKSVPSTVYRIENENSLLHITGKRTTQDTIVDKEFNAKFIGVLKARRVVEMLQRVELKDDSIKNQTNYQYKKWWSSRYIDSDDFHSPGYTNPKFPITSNEFKASSALVGIFTTDPLYLANVENYVPLTNIAKDAIAQSSTMAISGSYIYVDKKAADRLEVGAVRVRYDVVPEQIASFIGKQSGKTLQVYNTYTDKKIALVKLWQASIKSILDQIPWNSILRVRSLRIIGFVIMYGAILLLLGPVHVLQKERGDRDHKRPATPLIAWVIGFGAVLMNNALAWIFVKPWVSVVCIVLSILFILTIKKRSRFFSS